MSDKQLFYKDFTVTTLEIKGDYEVWANDLEEYFLVSGYPEIYDSIARYVIPTIAGNASAEAKAVHITVLKQSRYTLYRSIGTSIKKEIAKEKFATSNVLELWIAIRSCFYLRDESTIQQLRDDITAWDVEKAGGWNEFIEGIERYYTRLDVVAMERSYNSSDKLHKLRSVLQKLDGEREKSIFNQTELLVDTVAGDSTAVYNACFKFADKRMKLIERPTTTTTTKQAAFATTTTPQFTRTPKPCPYCKVNGHQIKDCPTKKSDTSKGTLKPCTTWNAKTRT